MAMKYKLLFTEILVGAMLGMACGVVFADTPMANLRLSTDMNGGGHSITNLDTISVSNAPWATPSEVTNIVTAIGGTGGGIEEEKDPIALPIATNAMARLKQLEQYGDASIVPSPDDWFEFYGGEITGFNYVAGREHVVIPYEHNGVPVTSIGNLAFSDAATGIGKPVVSVIAPKTVTMIGTFAFEGCTKLATVIFPSATSIDYDAFYNCIGLATVIFPSATSIGDVAFDNCSELTSITLGKTPPTWVAGTVATATIYVPFDAIGYSATFNGMPVIRATESADNFYLGGKTLEDRFLIKANAETIYTGAVCPASSGTQYYWTTGTNVTLSVGTISSGGTVSIAKLNNTATNSIIAIGQAGWEWTGGSYTNTITAGKSMTFGFLVDPSNGKTNAYATGVSK